MIFELSTCLLLSVSSPTNSWFTGTYPTFSRAQENFLYQV
ncbi:hypothetical protein S7335_5192 [Synechococcus sp. PCC 7335]|nr:hypothetical protein S7335_5192 [Synechococcus sp. PCC 7335]